MAKKKKPEWKGDGRDGAIWHLQLPNLRITVHRHIHYDPKEWLVSCVPDVLDKYVLKSKELEDAKTEALHLMRIVLECLLAQIAEAKGKK